MFLMSEEKSNTIDFRKNNSNLSPIDIVMKF